MKTQTEIEQQLDSKKQLSADLQARLATMYEEWQSIEPSDYVSAQLAIKGRLIISQAMAEIEYIDAEIGVLVWALQDTPTEGTTKCSGCGKVISANKLLCAACAEGNPESEVTN